MDQAALDALGQRVAGQALNGSIDVTEEAITGGRRRPREVAQHLHFVAGPRTYRRRAAGRRRHRPG
ncbi:MAG: hypothetical protein R2734_04080 [Nocardioides sp.]